MRLVRFPTLALVLFPGLAPLGAQDTSARTRVEALLPGLASTEAQKLDQAWTELERLCFQAGRPGAEEERKNVSAAIALQLGEGTPLPARLLLVRALERVGKGEVVTALARLLKPGNDAALREGARRALEANPHVNAKKELRTALREAEGDLLAGLIHSLGVRRDFLATADIIGFAESTEAAVRGAALVALAEIGDVSAVPVLEAALQKAQGTELALARGAYLRLGDSLVRNGERGAARRVYDRAAGFSEGARAAALIGFARAGLQSELERLVAALDAPAPAIRGAALEAAALFPGDAFSRKLVERLASKGSPELVEVLARRGAPAEWEALIQAARSSDRSEVRAAASRRLAAAPAALAAPALAALLDALGASEPVAGAAEAGLAGLALPDPGQVLAAELAGATGARRAALVRLLGARGGARATPTLLPLVSDGDPAVRAAAIGAIGRAGGEGSVEALLQVLERNDRTDRAAAKQALSSLSGDHVDAVLRERLASASGPGRAGLLEVIGARLSPGSLELLVQAARDKEPAMRAAALDGLARAGGPQALPLLLGALGDSDPGVRDAAVKGALRLAEGQAQQDPAGASEVYLKILPAASREEDLRAALRGIGDCAPPEALGALEAHLRPGPLQRDAGRAALRLAERLPEKDQGRARSTYEQLLLLDLDEATATQCVRRLRRLGVAVDPAAARGFLTHWWILGPIPNPEGKLLEAVFPPEQSVDLKAVVEIDGQKLSWQSHQVSSPRGIINLAEAAGGGSHQGVYLTTEITAASDFDGELKIGSDDQVVCWLDGVKLHASRVPRGLQVDQDVIPVKLARGSHRILLKVLNEEGGWEVCLRITTGDGKPAPLEPGGR